MPKIISAEERINRKKKVLDIQEKKLLQKVNTYKELYEKTLEIYNIKKKFNQDQIVLLNDVNSKISRINN